MMKLLQSTSLDKWIKEAGKKGLPIYGTCAGMIVLSKGFLNLMDIEIDRNAYGSQLDSFEDKIELKLQTTTYKLQTVFIRAPKIKTIGSRIKVIAHRKQEPVLVQQGNILASSLHPEFTKNTDIYQYFLSS